MKKRTKITVLLVILISCGSLSLLHPTKNDVKNEKKVISNNKDDNDVKAPVASFNIDWWGDFVQLKNDGYCTGSGSDTDPYVFDNLDITTTHDAFYIINTDKYFEIKNCRISGARLGIYLYNVKNGKLINNEIWDCWGKEISVSSSDNIQVIDNTVWQSDTDWGSYYDGGIGVSTSGGDVTITGNEVTNTGFSFGTSLTNVDHLSIDNSNKVNGKTVYWYVNEIDLNSADFINAGQIFLVNTNNSVMENLVFSNVAFGIDLSYSHNNTISNVHSNNNIEYGVYLYHSNYNQILSSETTGNRKYGAYMFESDNNTIFNLDSKSNLEDGIYFDGCNFNNVTYSDITENTGYAVYFESSSNNNVSYNDLRNNDKGSYFEDSGSFGNILEPNTLDSLPPSPPPTSSGGGESSSSGGGGGGGEAEAIPGYELSIFIISIIATSLILIRNKKKE